MSLRQHVRRTESEILVKAVVTLYTRPGCHLCAAARRELLAAGHTDSYDLAEIDIDLDPALLARYGWDIPVVAINGVVVFKHRLSAADFRHELQRRMEKQT